MPAYDSLFFGLRSLCSYKMLLSVRGPPETETVEDNIFGLLQGIGFCDHGHRSGKSEVHRAGQKPLGSCWCPSPPEEFLLLQGNLNSVPKAFQLMQLGPPRLFRIISFIWSQLIIDVNHIHTVSSYRHPDTVIDQSWHVKLTMTMAITRVPNLCRDCVMIKWDGGTQRRIGLQ